jgi:hypothetical protein
VRLGSQPGQLHQPHPQQLFKQQHTESKRSSRDKLDDSSTCNVVEFYDSCHGALENVHFNLVALPASSL